MQLLLPYILLPALLFLLPFQAFTQSQPCNNYPCKMELARKAFKAGKYKSALDLARGAENYDASKKAEVNTFIDEVFAEIEGKRVEAELQRYKADVAVERANREAEIARSEKMRADLAEQASKRAADSIAVAKKQTDAALSRSERLSRYFEFKGEKAAWAYWRGFFAVINAAGDTLTDFVYENPEPFAAGRAWAKADNQFVLVGDNGKEISGRYDYRFGLSNGKGYFAGGKQADNLIDSMGRVIFQLKPLSEVNAFLSNNSGATAKAQPLIVHKDGRYGFVDKQNYTVIIEPGFQNLGPFSDGLAPVMLGDKWGAIDYSGKISVEPEYGALGVFSEGLARMRDKYFTAGYIDRTGRTVISFANSRGVSYWGLHDFSNGLALVRDFDFKRSTEKYYYIDHTGKKVIHLRKNPYFATPFSDSVAVVYNRKGVGIMNRQGNIKLVPGADFLAMFSEGLARFQRRSKWGFLNKQGHIVCSPVYDELNEMSDGFAFAKKQGNWLPLDRNGRALAYHRIDAMAGFTKGLTIAQASANAGAKSGLINQKGQAVADFTYDEIIDNGNGTYWVAFEKKWGLLDKEGRLVLQFKYNIIESQNKQIANYPLPVKLFLLLKKIKYPGKKTLKRINRQYGRENQADRELVHFRKKGKHGFRDQDGKVVIPPKYFNAGLPSEGLIPVAVEANTWGYINERDSMVIPPVFGYALKFINGTAEVKIPDSNRLYLINTQGHWVLPPDSDLFMREQVNRNVIIVGKKDAGLMGIYNNRGKEILPVKYQTVRSMGNGFIMASINGQSGLADSTGALVLPCEYDRLYPSAYRICLTEQNGRYGLFAPDHGVLLPCKYEQIGFLEEENDWIRVRQNGKWGWVDKTGNVMISCRFDATTPFQNGRAKVMQAPYPMEFKINLNGEMLLGE